VRPLIALCLILLTFLTVACDPGKTIVIENRTDDVVDIYLSDNTEEIEYTLQPQQTVKLTIIRDVWKNRLIARGRNGSTLYDSTLTWREFKALDKISLYSSQ